MGSMQQMMTATANFRNRVFLRKKRRKPKEKQWSTTRATTKGNQMMVRFTDRSSPNFPLYCLICSRMSSIWSAGCVCGKALKIVTIGARQQGQSSCYWLRLLQIPKMQAAQYECPHVTATRNTLGSTKQMQHSLSSSRSASCNQPSTTDVRTLRISRLKAGRIHLRQTSRSSAQPTIAVKSSPTYDIIMMNTRHDYQDGLQKAGTLLVSVGVCLGVIQSMWDRYAQEDKFRNITLRIEDGQGEGMRRQLEESEQILLEKEQLISQKEEIISQLKEIIRLSNDNHSRVRIKRQEEEELRQLRHSVRVLTIENNALSTYIDKLKQGDGETALREEVRILRQQLRAKEFAFENKVDEFIASHKSLAQQCRRLQQAKEAAQQERERAWATVRELQETQRRPQEKQRTGILKIRQQYAQSVQQIRDTIHIQMETQFDSFTAALNLLQTHITTIERRIQQAEQQLFGKSGRDEIYIEEGQGEGDRVGKRGLQEEVTRLRQLVSDLQLASERDNYTFREQEQSTQRERQLSTEVDGLKEEIDRLQSAYRHEKAQTTLKMQQYDRLCVLFSQEKQRNTEALQILGETKRQLGEYGRRGQAQAIAFAAIQKQNKELMAANQQLRAKLEKTIGSLAKTAQQHQLTKQHLKQTQIEKSEWQLRAQHNQRLMTILQEQLKSKKEAEEALLTEKRALEGQLISYLSIFNKLSWDEKPTTGDSLQPLIATLDSLEASFSHRQSLLESGNDVVIG